MAEGSKISSIAIVLLIVGLAGGAGAGYFMGTSTMQTQISEHLAQIEVLDEELHNCITFGEECLAANERLTEVSNEKVMEAYALQEELEEKDQTIADLEETNAFRLEQVANLTSELVDMESELALYADVGEDFQLQLNNLTSLLANKSQEVYDLKQEIIVLEDKVKRLDLRVSNVEIVGSKAIDITIKGDATLYGFQFLCGNMWAPYRYCSPGVPEKIDGKQTFRITLYHDLSDYPDQDLKIYVLGRADQYHVDNPW